MSKMNGITTPPIAAFVARGTEPKYKVIRRTEIAGYGINDERVVATVSSREQACDQARLDRLKLREHELFDEHVRHEVVNAGTGNLVEVIPVT